MNDLDPQAVIGKSAVVFSDANEDDAEFHTGPLDVEALLLEASLKVRAVSFYPNVGPRRSAKPVPATAHVAPVAVIPDAVKGDAQAMRRSFITMAVFAGLAGISAWLVLVTEVFL